MGDFTVRIEDRELTAYMRYISGVGSKVITSASRWIRRLSKRAETSMKTHSKPKTSRGTGKLSSSITTKYSIRGSIVGASVYVPSNITYQYAAEYGFKRRFVIKGKPKMTFPSTSWGGAVKIPNRGYFVFTQVVRGRYPGKRFTEKAFKTTIKMYERNKTKILNEIGNVILFSRS